VYPKSKILFDGKKFAKIKEEDIKLIKYGEKVMDGILKNLGE